MSKALIVAAVRGRPTSYRPEYADQMLEYFITAAQTKTEQTKVTIEESEQRGKSSKIEVQEILAGLPTFQRFALSIGVSTRTTENWRKQYPEFEDAYWKCKDIIEDFFAQGLSSGRMSGIGAVFLAKNMTRFTDDTTVTVQQPDREKPILAAKTPAQLEALRAVVLAAEAAGVKVSIDDTAEKE